jgi:murein DD-endopeptidase MepM/ murein hydrolase activator NlpD
MEFFKKFPAFLIITTLLFSCSQKPASISNRSKNVYTKNNSANKEKYRKDHKEIARVERLKSHEAEVENGDTLYSISKKYQVTLRDLIKANNLSAPYNLKAKTKLIIPTPNYHEVKQGETLYAISRIYNMKIDNLIEMNDLQPPYSVKVGEKIRISKIDDKTEISQNQNKSESRLNKEEKVTTKLVEPEQKPLAKVGAVTEKTPDKSNHFSWPIKGPVVSKFGPKSGGLYNDGINIKAKEGSDVKASEDGVVAYVGNELKGYGNLVIVKHSSGWITAYAHLQNAVAKRGQVVVKGEKIGTVGSTGNVTSPQLYFGLRKGRDAVNPENYLKM